MRGLVSAIQRQQGRAQALQAQVLRVAVWGGADDFSRMVDRLNGGDGKADAAIADAGALCAALGLGDAC